MSTVKRYVNKLERKSTSFAGWSIKRTASVNGLPDIVAIKDGIYIGIEVKAPKGKQSESQKAIQAEIEKAGGKYIVARSLDDVKVIFEKGKK